MSGEDQELASLDRILTRLALTDDDKLETVSGWGARSQRPALRMRDWLAGARTWLASRARVGVLP